MAYHAPLRCMKCSDDSAKDTAYLSNQIEEIIDLLELDRSKIVGGASDGAAAQKNVILFMIDFWFYNFRI